MTKIKINKHLILANLRKFMPTNISETTATYYKMYGFNEYLPSILITEKYMTCIVGLFIWLVDLWCLMPLSKIFQLY